MQEVTIESAILLMAKWYDPSIQEKPSFFHSVRTCTLLYRYGYATEICIGGMLHDILEDTDIPKEIISETYGVRVLEIVEAATKNRSLEKSKILDDIIDRSIAYGHDAIIVKLAESFDNWLFYTKLKKEGAERLGEIARSEYIIGRLFLAIDNTNIQKSPLVVHISQEIGIEK